MIIEYNGFSLEERRISHFIINALRDPNHRQNEAIQFQHLRQSPNQTFDYWLNIIRTLPTTTPTLPPGLQQVHYAETDSPRQHESKYSASSAPPGTLTDTRDRSNTTTDTCEHCGRPGHNITKCYHYSKSEAYKRDYYRQKRDYPSEYRRSQSPVNSVRDTTHIDQNRRIVTLNQIPAINNIK